MELLLNVAWLLLALPAWWLFRRRMRYAAFVALQSLVALACALLLLFPIISATDDLHAMRAEMEESPVSKRTARQASTDTTPGLSQQQQAVSALPVVPASVGMPECGRYQASFLAQAPLQTSLRVIHERAPPAFLS